MGYDLLAGIGFLILVPLVTLGFAAFWAFTNHERQVLENEWRAFAESRGRDYEPASGEWPNRTSPAGERSEPG